MNNVVHFEIPAENLERAKEFYSEIFGWKIEETMPEYYLAYTTKTDEKMMPIEPGAINGGIQMKDNDTGKNPIIVINVPDIDDYLQKIEKMGGNIAMPKMNVDNMLYYARFYDPEGNVMGIVEYIKNP